MSRGIVKMVQKNKEKEEKEANKENEKVEGKFKNSTFVSGVMPKIRVRR